MKKLIYCIVLFFQLFTVALAQEAFVVRNIQVVGTQRISPATVESYMPIKRGQTLQPAKTAAILRSLYQTGFFEHITLSKQNGTLIVHVTERPTIGQLKITGNSVIPTDKLTSVMSSFDIAEGRVYNPAMLERIKQGLLNQYYQLGRYNARVDVTVSPMVRDRVLVRINISEGVVAKIKRISVIGNHVFDEKTLVNQLDISTTDLFTFVTQTDRYSEVKLDMAIEKLRNYYLDHGYLRATVKAGQAEVTPDRKSVYITFVVDEGELYTIKDYRITGKLIVPREEIIKQITVRPGEPFARQKIIDSEKNITSLFGSKGYIFSSINLRPQVNDKDHTAILIFDINPGKRTYVRQITFSENNRTNDVVLRREMEQLEGAPASTSKLDESKRRLSLLPYLKEVDMSVKPVPEVDDQIDVNYKVKEDNSAQATFKVGYSLQDGYLLGAGLNQKNVFGTGNTLGLNFTQSKVEQYYGIDYTDPYYTADGISRSLNFAVSRVNPGAISRINSSYTNNEYDLGVLYGIPVGQEEGVFNRIFAGISYQNILINLISGKVSNQVNSFINEHGRHYQQADIRLGFSRNSYDKAIFTTKGALQTLFVDAYAPLDSNSLTFYTINYHGKLYEPLSDQFIFVTRGDFGYGNGLHGINDFPFFKNYYAGGMETVRGYMTNTLGPQDSNGLAYGGNLLIDGSVGLIFPNYLSDNLRTSVYLDAGNVYSSLNNTRFGGLSANSGPIRYSVGVEADFLSPLGPIALSLAKPLHYQSGKPNDHVKVI